MTDQGMPAFELARAADLVQRGRLGEAEAAYRRLVAVRPDAIEQIMGIVVRRDVVGLRLEIVGGG